MFFSFFIAVTSFSK